MQLRWPYPESPGVGVYGPVTSNHNFCEEDYVITPYIAEFVNTLTNATYVIYGVYGLLRVRTHKEGGYLSTLAFPYWGLIGVGVLSAYFHATLKYHSQMGDDLSMFLAAGAVLHQLLCFNASVAERRKYTLAIMGTVLPVSVYHVWADEIIAHEITFAIMIFLVSKYARALIKKQVRSEDHRKKLGSMATFGISMGLFGYFLWNIDFHLCGYVTTFKHWLGLPWGFLFELHAWWHIFTGIAAYVGMAVVEYLVTIEEEREGGFEEGFVWPVRGLMRSLAEMDGPKMR
ncbi:similar to alkaline ceramidase [Plenodomus lingam JN3]|uniref:Similar to alkaline ceramidase n=1 Tax=Leptosphaeria maculans (strain JN3 / isolate v23.1.3 / race Av1-4-5-6-7-8) TaxID=985895 RepID=E4ZN38_LEPMJ|nr:similar to alkaline ceramidase [Plenodomus lingam JN3]CBX92641.1 similar to alkaline ceramidase [Plenodomus lingam JN3]